MFLHSSKVFLVYFLRCGRSPTKDLHWELPFATDTGLRQAQYSQGPPCALLLAGCLAWENVVSQHGDLNSVFFILYVEFLGYLLFGLVLGFLLLVFIIRLSILTGNRPFFSHLSLLSRESCFVQSKSILVMRKNYRIERRHLLYTLVVQACLTDKGK